jgi:sister chromatid cohesion protein DCC1
VKEVLELVPAVPRLHKLGILLRGMEYDEGQDEEGMDVDDDISDGDGDRPVSPSLSYQP